MMTVKFRSWWQQIKKHPYATGVLLVLILFIFFAYRFGWVWTGFNEHIGQNIQQYQPTKTLWDWLSLLFVPGVLTLGAIWFTSRQNHDREIAVDNQSEAALQAYLSKMSDLLLGEPNLANSPEGHVIRKIARAQTLTVLPRLDPERKRSVLLFLHESGLINTNKPVIDLLKANLKGTALDGADLTGAALDGAILWSANLDGANLSGADLSGADLNSANLSGANLSGVDLSGANMKGAKYNTKMMQWMNAQGIPLTLEPTQWPQGFDPKVAGAICVDC